MRAPLVDGTVEGKERRARGRTGEQVAGRLTGAIVPVVALAGALLGGVWLFADRPPSAKPASLPAPTRPVRPVAPPWTPAQLDDLVGAVGQADAEGLRASDYRIDALRAAAGQRRPGEAASRLADDIALSLARDFSAGHVRNRHRFNWYIDTGGPAPAELARMIVAARSRGRLRQWLDGLLPTGPDYRALRAALASTDEPNRRDRIRANMERWRWLPRDIGRGDQLRVNLPAYRLEMIEDGRTVASYRAVIGATDMPTPVLSATVKQVVANPDWIVPDSIVRRSRLRPGASSRYIFTTRPDGTVRVRQKPGPGNALGRVKIVFPNPLAIYFHDTPSRSLFGASARAFSHGCVRVQDIDALAASLVAAPDRLRTALAGTQTRWFTPARAWRATIVYLTLVHGADGTLVDVGDPYHADEPLAAALDGRKPRTRRPAPAPTPTPTVDRPAAAASTAIDPAPAGAERDAASASPAETANGSAER